MDSIRPIHCTKIVKTQDDDTAKYLSAKLTETEKKVNAKEVELREKESAWATEKQKLVAEMFQTRLARDNEKRNVEDLQKQNADQRKKMDSFLTELASIKGHLETAKLMVCYEIDYRRKD